MGTERLQNLPKHPPCSVESEANVLGALLLTNELWHDLSASLSAADFYRADHQVLYAAIGEMIGAGKTCDLVTLPEHLRARGLLEDPNLRPYISQLAVDTYSLANVRAYAAIVREKSVLRSLIAAGSEIGDLGYRPEGRTQVELLDD